jgi:hypothetical protein
MASIFDPRGPALAVFRRAPLVAFERRKRGYATLARVCPRRMRGTAADDQARVGFKFF